MLFRSSCSFNPVLFEQRTDALRQPTRRGRSKSKAEPRELCKQRREREISPSSIRSRGLNLHNQLDVTASVEYLIDNKSSPIKEVDFGSNDTYIFSPFFLFVSVYVYASVCDFVCIALLLPFVLGFCLSVFFILLKNFFFLIIFYFLF